MNYTLFTKLYSIFNMYANPKAESPYKFLDSLLSLSDHFSDEVVNFRLNMNYAQARLYLTDSSYKRNIPRKILKYLQMYPLWTIPDSKDPQGVYNKLEDLHHEFLPDIDTPEDINQLFTNLVRFCFTNSAYCFDPSLHFAYSSHITGDRQTFKDFIGRKKELDELSSLLKKYQKVCISGDTGIGKTMCVKYFLFKNHQDYSEFCYVKYAYNLESTLSQIILSSTERATFSSLQLLNPKALLIIDDINVPTKELYRILCKLKTLNLNIIALTRNPAPLNDFPLVVLSHLPMDDLLTMIPVTQHCDSIKIYLSSVEYNTLLVSLFSKSLRQEKTSLGRILDYCRSEVKTTAGKLPNFKTSYDEKEKTYFGHIKELIFTFRFKEADMNALHFLSCLPNVQIPIKYLIKLLDVSPSWLQRMIESNVLTKADNSSVQMPQLIADTLYLNATHTISNYKAYIKCINTILDSCINGNPYEWNMKFFVTRLIQRLNPFVKPVHNKTQKTISKMQTFWCSFIYNAIKYIQTLNDPMLVSVLLNCLSNSNNELLSQTIFPESTVYSLFNNWIAGNTDAIENHINTLSDWIKKNYLTIDINLIYLLTSLLSVINLDAILLDMLRDKPYTTSPKLALIYHNCFDALKADLVSENQYEYYKYMDFLLSCQSESKFIALVENLYFYSSKCNNLSIKIQGLSMVIYSYYKTILLAYSNAYSRDLVNVFLRGVSNAMQELRVALEKVTLLSHLDFSFCMWGYIYYFLIFSRDADVVSNIHSLIISLLKKAPYINADEKKSLISLFDELVSNSLSFMPLN